MNTGIGFLQFHSATLIKIALKGIVAWFYFQRDFMFVPQLSVYSVVYHSSLCVLPVSTPW